MVITIALLALMALAGIPVVWLLHYFHCMRQRRQWWIANGNRKLKERHMIQVLYSCRCGITDKAVSMREREYGESVVDWVEKVMTPAIDQDHTASSPTCTSRTMESVKIPMDGRPRIGGPIIN